MDKLPLFPIDISNLWRIVPDGYEPAALLYQDHYSAYQYADNRRNQHGYRNRFLIVGPGEKMVLMTPNDDALFVWRKFIDASGQTGVNCAVFRNCSQWQSSELIRQACALAWWRWPEKRLYTYVNADAIRSSNPGYCFLAAGWHRLSERTKKNGLRILEHLPRG